MWVRSADGLDPAGASRATDCNGAVEGADKIRSRLECINQKSGLVYRAFHFILGSRSRYSILHC
jgi:hypothetical protein